MHQHFETDVLIVGGGPAGTSTALGLLQYSNLQVTLVEQGAFDGVKVGEQVNASLFPLLEYLHLSKSRFSEHSFTRGYRSMAAWGSPRISAREAIHSTQEASYQLDREQFDWLLLEAAAERGATVLPRTKCLTFKQLDNHEWHVELVHQTRGALSVKARYLIDATGRQSTVCRKLGVASTQHDDLVAVGAFFHFADTQTLSQDVLIETTPAGWWYCATLPHQRVTVTLFTDADLAKKQQLQKTENWAALLSQTQHIQHKLRHATVVDPLWTRNAFSQVSNPTTRPHLLAVGDAAASFDPISSMGIGFAVSSACHAAKAILDYEQGATTALADYQRGIEGIFGNYLRTQKQHYRRERRWPDAPFWQRRLAESGQP